jgi:hypothetical protein
MDNLFEEIIYNIDISGRICLWIHNSDSILEKAYQRKELPKKDDNYI